MTEFSKIFDLFLSIISDYRLNTIYSTSGSRALNLYLTPWLLYSIREFEPICDQSLEIDPLTEKFMTDLTIKNQLILAQLMSRYWLQKELQDIQQMQLHLQDRDYKTYSEAQNLKSKLDLYNAKREEISQMLMDYKLNDTSMWKKWSNQNFS